MKKTENQHNRDSYAELILLDSEKSESEEKTPQRKRLVPGMFSSVTEAELIIETLGSEAVEVPEI